jgi:hypothetical protein
VWLVYLVPLPLLLPLLCMLLLLPGGSSSLPLPRVLLLPSAPLAELG